MKFVRFAGASALCVLIQGGALAASAAPVAQGVSHRSSHLAGTRNDTETSTNWSGYAVETTGARRFTDIMGTWIEPRATCVPTSAGYASFWIGIDGYLSKSVEQLGTDSDCSGTVPSYYAWWEMYPAGSTELLPTKFPVKPGDTLTAGVSVADGHFTLTLSSSEGWKFTTVQPGSASLQQSSAEWIAEAPEIGNSTALLAHFTPFRFSKCGAATNGRPDGSISSFKKGHDIHMVTSGGAAKATPSALSPTGNGFTVTWEHA